MKREKFSPNIESENNVSKLAAIRGGLGKKAAALLLTGSIATGAAACSDNENAPVTPNETVATMESEDNIEGLDANEILSQDSEQPFTEKDIYYEENPYTGNLSWINLPKGSEYDLSPDGSLEVYEFGEPGPNVYRPQYEKYKDRSSVVEVGGETIDVEEYTHDPEVRYHVETSSEISNTQKYRYMMGQALYDGPMYNEHIRSRYSKSEAEKINKEYKILDENATNQEILDNYDIEMAMISRAEYHEVRSKQMSRTDKAQRNHVGELTEAGIIAQTGGDRSLSSDHDVVRHNAATDPDSTTNYTKGFDRSPALGAGASVVKNGRKIAYSAGHGNYRVGHFYYYDYENAGEIYADRGLSKWTQVAYFDIDSETYNREYKNKEQTDNKNSEVVDKYGDK